MAADVPADDLTNTLAINAELVTAILTRFIRRRSAAPGSNGR